MQRRKFITLIGGARQHGRSLRVRTAGDAGGWVYQRRFCQGL